MEKMREEERKEHPKEKERERAKKKYLEELDRNFHQKEEHWLKREREKVPIA
jgi:RNA-binding protein 25